MDNSGYSRNRHNEHLGVNKIGKNIRKSPLHQSNFANNPVSRQQQQQQQSQQPQVYNINKNDFRNIVQQLTGSPSHHSQEPLLPRPPPPKSPSMRLQRIRPPPLAPISVNRPRMVIPQMPLQHGPSRPGQYGQPPPRNMVQVQPPSQPQPYPHPPLGSGNHPVESPISSYMRYLEHSINDSPQVRSHMQAQQHQQSAGLLPYPSVGPIPSPRTNGPSPFLSPRTNGNGNGGKGYPPLLPSPTSQFLLPSPSGYLNLASPRSPYPLLSPGYQHPPPLTPNNPFSPMGQPGILGPGPQPPLSPGVGFPLSPGFFPLSSPRWRRD